MHEEAASTPFEGDAPATGPQAGLHTTISRLLLLAALFVAPIGYLTHSALVRPEVEFLAASERAEWALYPGQNVKLRGRPVSRDVIFRRVFDPAEVSTRHDLGIRAFTDATVTLNGEVVKPNQSRASWKHPVTFSLFPHLKDGPNTLSIRVRNPDALPALLVESPPELATPGAWEARVVGNPAGFTPAVVPLAREANPGLIQQSPAWRWARWPAGLWLLLVAGIGAWVLVAEGLGRRRSDEPDSAPRGPPSPWLRAIVPASILLAAAALNFANASAYPYFYGVFDWWGHLEYVRLVASEWRPPLAVEGWEMCHPPLYFFCAAVAYTFAGGDGDPEAAVKAVQYLGCAAGLGLLLLTWLTARRLLPHDVPAQWAALAFAAFLPMNLYMNPQVSNEVFAAAVTAAALYGAIRLVEAPALTWRLAAATGILAGASLLSKFTGLFPCGACAAALVLRAIHTGQRADLAAIAAFGLAVLAVCGWFYLRNVIHFGHPFAGNWNHTTGWHIEQLPAFRTFEFYAHFGSVFYDHPTESIWSSFVNGLYATLWADAGHAFVADAENPAFGWMSVAILVAALPTAAIVLGLLRMLASALHRPALNRDVVLIATALWAFQALVLATMEQPIAAAIKAFYFMFLVPTLALALAQGRAMLRRQLPWSRWLLDLTLVLLAALAIWIYRFAAWATP